MTQTIIEWLKAIGTVIAAVSLYLAYRQLRANIRWNRVNATFTYLPETTYIEREHAAATELEPVGIDLYKQEQPLAAETVTRILSDSHVFRKVKDFLNLFEDYATAYKAKAIDRDLSYILIASRFIRYYVMFKPLIEAVRDQSKNEMYWIEFERLVTDDWQPRQKKEIEKAARTRQKSRGGASYP